MSESQHSPQKRRIPSFRITLHTESFDPFFFFDILHSNYADVLHTQCRGKSVTKDPFLIFAVQLRHDETSRWSGAVETEKRDGVIGGAGGRASASTPPPFTLSLDVDSWRPYRTRKRCVLRFPLFLLPFAALDSDCGVVSVAGPVGAQSSRHSLELPIFVDRQGHISRFPFNFGRLPNGVPTTVPR